MTHAEQTMMIDDILDQDPTILEDLEKINIENEQERIGEEDRKGMNLYAQGKKLKIPEVNIG